MSSSSVPPPTSAARKPSCRPTILARWIKLNYKGLVGRRAFGAAFSLPEEGASPAVTVVGGTGEPTRNLATESTRLALSSLAGAWVDRAGLAGQAGFGASSLQATHTRSYISGGQQLSIALKAGGALSCNALVSNTNNPTNPWLPSSSETYCQLHILSTDQKRWAPADLNGVVRPSPPLRLAGQPDDEEVFEAADGAPPIARIGGATAVLDGSRLVLFGGLTSRKHAEMHPTTAAMLAIDEASAGAQPQPQSGRRAPIGGVGRGSVPSDRSPVFLNDLCYFSWSKALMSELGSSEEKAERQVGIANVEQHRQNERLVADAGLVRPNTTVLQIPTMLTPASCRAAYPEVFSPSLGADAAPAGELIVDGDRCFIERDQPLGLASYVDASPSIAAAVQRALLKPKKAPEGDKAANADADSGAGASSSSSSSSNSSSDGPSHGPRLTKPQAKFCKGRAPCPRAFAQLAVVSSGLRSTKRDGLGFSLILFGGMTYGRRLLNDIHVLSLVPETSWSTPKVRIAVPLSLSPALASPTLALPDCFHPSLRSAPMLYVPKASGGGSSTSGRPTATTTTTPLTVDSSVLRGSGSAKQQAAYDALCPTTVDPRAFASAATMQHPDPAVREASGKLVFIFGGRKSTSTSGGSGGGVLDDLPELTPAAWASASSSGSGSGGGDGGGELAIEDTLGTLCLDAFDECRGEGGAALAPAGASTKKSKKAAQYLRPPSYVVVSYHSFDQATWGHKTGLSALIAASTSSFSSSSSATAAASGPLVSALAPSPRAGMQVLPVGSIAGPLSSSSASSSAYPWRWQEELMNLHCQGLGETAGEATSLVAAGGVGSKRPRAPTDPAPASADLHWARDVMAQSQFYIVFGGASMAQSSDDAEDAVLAAAPGAGSSSKRKTGGAGAAVVDSSGPVEYHSDLYLLQLFSTAAPANADSTSASNGTTAASSDANANGGVPKWQVPLRRLSPNAATYGLDHCCSVSVSKLIRRLVGPSRGASPLPSSSSSSSSSAAVVPARGRGRGGTTSKSNSEGTNRPSYSTDDDDVAAADTNAESAPVEQPQRKRQRSRSRSRSESVARGREAVSSAAPSNAAPTAANVNDEGSLASLIYLSNRLNVPLQFPTAASAAGAGASSSSSSAVPPVVMLMPQQQLHPHHQHHPQAAPPVDVDAIATAVINRLTGGASSSSSSAASGGAASGGVLGPVVSGAMQQALGQYFSMHPITISTSSLPSLLTTDRARGILESGVRSIVESTSREGVSAVAREVRASVQSLLASEVGELQRSIKAMADRLTSQNSESQTQQAQSHQHQLSASNKRADEAEAQLSVYRRRLEEVEADREKLNGRLRDEQGQSAKVAAELKLTREALAKRESELERSEAEVRRLNGELFRFHNVLGQLGAVGQQGSMGAHPAPSSSSSSSSSSMLGGGVSGLGALNGRR